MDLLAEFASADVRYLVVGGYAVGFHDRPRTTKDLDILLGTHADNIAKACRALEDFGAPASVVADLASTGTDEIVWMGAPPVRVDLLKEVPGVDFDAAYQRRAVVPWEGVPVSIISRQDLIIAKRAAGRDQDLVDAKNLERGSRQGST